MKGLIAGTVAVFAAMCYTGNDSIAAEPAKKDVRDLKALTCKDVMRLSGDDRSIALAFAHGYVLGKKGRTQYDVEALSQITDKFIDHCLDNPKDNALASFETIAK